MHPFALAIAFALLAILVPAAARPQSAEAVAKIGFLSAGSQSGWTERLAALREGLRTRGYLENRNLIIEYRWAEGRNERLEPLASELIERRVNLIVAAGTPAALAAKRATSTTAVVMVEVADPVATGLVASLARPGGNVTGVALLGEALFGKQLELLKELIPSLNRVGFLYNPSNPTQRLVMKRTASVAESHGLKFSPVGVQHASELPAAIASAAAQPASALIVTRDSIFVDHMARVVELTAKARIPAVYGYREFVLAGGLLAYGPSPLVHYRQAAAYVEKILKGARPSDLPIEQAAQFELVLNLHTALRLDLKVPQTILIRADEVIR
jgi:putative ABC transport system substrate-binding protein